MTDPIDDREPDAPGPMGPIPWARVSSSFAVGDPDLEAQLVDRIVDPESIPTLFLVARLLGGVDVRHDPVGLRLALRWRAWLEERTYAGVGPTAEERPIVVALADVLDHRARRKLALHTSDEPTIEHDLRGLAASAHDEYDDDDETSDEFASDVPSRDEPADRARWTEELEFARRLRAWAG